MSEYTDVLERIGDRVPMPEPALDRMVLRREQRRRNRRISAGVLGLIITVVLVLALASTRPAVAPQPRNTTSPAASNGWIAYTLPGRGIYLVEEGQAPRLAIGTPGDDAVERCPAFSPDGTHLAFTRERGTGPIRTFVADIGDPGVVGGSERPVATSGGEYWQCPKWAPDGTRLLYADDEGVWAVGMEPGELPILLWRFGDLVDVGWSPDGSLVAAMSRDGEVWIVSAQDGTLVTQTYGLANARLSWSPSGDRIAVGQGATDQLSPVLLINVENGDREELTASGRGFAGYGSPSWSPDGTSIALLDHHDADEGIVIVRPDEDTWYRIPLPTLDVPDIWGLRWSPDGQRLLVASGCSVQSIQADSSGEPTFVSSPDVDPQRCQTPPGLDWQPVFP